MTEKVIRVLMLVDHAVGISGPHRNVVGSLNALSARDDIDLRLLTGRIDESEPYASRCDIHLGFDPHNPRSLMQNLRLVLSHVKDRDLIYVPTGLKSFLYGFAARRRGRKLAAGPNVSAFPFPWRKDSPGTIELKLMTDCWFEASQARQQHVIGQTGNHSIRFVHHAIDTMRFSLAHRNDALWDAYGVPHDRIKILYVGHDQTLRKGVEILIEAIQHINMDAQNEERLAFIFAGKLSNTNRSKLEAIPNAYPIGFLYPDQLPQVMASADMSVVPSSWENFPFSVLEAMASGLPIVAVRTGGIPEQVAHGETGLLVDATENGQYITSASTVIAEAIISLAFDDEQRAVYGRNARQRVLSHFSEQRLGEDLYALFASTLQREMEKSNRVP